MIQTCANPDGAKQAEELKAKLEAVQERQKWAADTDSALKHLNENLELTAKEHETYRSTVSGEPSGSGEGNEDGAADEVEVHRSRRQYAQHRKRKVICCESFGHPCLRQDKPTLIIRVNLVFEPLSTPRLAVANLSNHRRHTCVVIALSLVPMHALPDSLLILWCVVGAEGRSGSGQRRGPHR